MTPRPARSLKSRVLVIEDSPEIQYLLSVILHGEDRKVLMASTAAEAREELDVETPSLVVLDLILPDTDGRTLLTELRRAPATAGTPVVVITSHANPETRAECYSLGADAFVEKPFDPDAFAADISERLERIGRTQRDSGRDLLTGLGNITRLVQAVGELPAEGSHALVLSVLDGLRDVLERYGWETGDTVVVKVAEALARVFNDEAVELCRITADEFALLVPGCDVEKAHAHAGRIVDVVRKASIPAPDGEIFRLTASAGFVFLDERTNRDDVAAILDKALDMAFKAQGAGGNRVWSEAEGRSPTDAAPVLVAEDDDITAKILCHRLEKEGFEVVRYSDGRDAYKGALEATPAMVILDVKMPGMDGFEVLERLRKTPSYTRVPIVLLTSLGSDADVVRGFQLGADDYILKPFSAAELVARVRRLLRRGREPRVD